MFCESGYRCFSHCESGSVSSCFLNADPEPDKAQKTYEDFAAVKQTKNKKDCSNVKNHGAGSIYFKFFQKLLPVYGITNFLAFFGYF